MRALLLLVLLAACSQPHHYAAADRPGSRFVCSADGYGADVYEANGQTVVHPTGWRCDYSEWQRTGRINVIGGQ